MSEPLEIGGVPIEPLPRLDVAVSELALPAPLGQLTSPPWLVDLLGTAPRGGPAVEPPDDAVRAAVRDALRDGGFRPTGRNKPSSEYLARAAAELRLPSINLAVDLGNAVSLHTGLPISAVDLDRVRPPLRIVRAPAAAAYVFNRSGQTIDVAGLPCLADADGPCANAVKDAERTKTDRDTRRVLFVVWGAAALAGRSRAAAAWLRALAARAGA